ncbi:transglutaminase family protein [Paraburkholderia acidiphila]|uniref:Transglutaminase family protein n=2 Tax=Paraburkholderia acidiphila TaxID=2571747 RepID=A0A7Z2GAS6_9BURK|nr:transglutaminase family protein [Paraburkholderia acidiphila]QGZ58380.1 transglutaminase family protein [Paraburkholderia acidiphila]
MVMSGTRLAVTHRTTYRYSTLVETAQHLATIRPLDLPWQRVLAHRERIDPAPSYQTSRRDAFGNEVLYFSFDAPHDYLQMTSETSVLLTPRYASLDADGTPPWEDVAHRLRYTAGGAFHAESEFCFASPNIALHPGLRAYALESFTPGTPVLAGAIDLMHRIHIDFEYLPSATAFDTPAARAFELRHGVCQDFAQVMIGCLRSIGLAARYVSGYLRNDPPEDAPPMIGADASHAWVSLYVPPAPSACAAGWIDLDPTNDVLADQGHVTLAIGRDYTDVSLLRGVILGGGAHRVDVAVSVNAD